MAVALIRLASWVGAAEMWLDGQLMAPPHVGAHGAVAWMAVVTALLASLHGLGPMHLALTVRMGFGRFVPCMKTEDEVMHPHVSDTCGLSSVVIPQVICGLLGPRPVPPTG